MGGAMLLLIDETLQKGYGFSTGFSLFAVLSVSTKFVWNALSLSTQDIGRGKEFIGAIVSLVHGLFTRNFKNALIESFYRTHLPNVFEVYGNILAFGAVVFLLNFRYDINVKSTKVRTPSSNYPIRLLYTGNVPIYMFYAIVSNLFIFSNILFRLFPSNVVVRLIGTWEQHGDNPQLFAVSGLCYYLQPPFGLVEALWDPIKTVIYASTLILAAIYFAKTWTEISGSSPRDIAKQFKDNDIVIVGHRDVAILRELKKIITPAAAIGGALSAAVIVLPDLLGFTGSGLLMFIGASTIYTYFEIIAQESGQPGFSVGNW
ncbi:translocon subunit SEC61 [Sugiyamaella lignohabitans]|uniref:Translocon subunit SEC61 n=1 Tax=Sugiyamaella lignohabitans TaxID=796027 RepID=A0A167F060_9ASCO|nr:translocon subunit SEC61 [Sugiyamaella lignohabitans]ANB14658.1 translocon subunit SEC61 [Sugiyamaella lignohabitans]